MLRTFCDWCKKEITAGDVFGAHGRLVRLEAMSVYFKFEFRVDANPEHLCIPCASAKIEEALIKLQEPEPANIG